MQKLVLILLQISLAFHAVLTASVTNSENDLIYIGTFRSPNRGNSRVIDENNYYISTNQGSWNSATNDCHNILGENGTLVAIESEEEWEFLKETLENYGFATTYWTSGLYDPSNSHWRWKANDVPLPPFAPWGPGYPSTPNTLLRVLIYYTNPYDAYWRTVSNTQQHRYICEIQVPTIAVPCYETNDLAILLDSSGSIGADNFEKAKTFVEHLAYAFTVNRPSRLSFLTFSTDATLRIQLNNGLSRTAISSSILATPYEAGLTETALGIDLAASELISNERGLPLNLVILTDGQSNEPYLTIDAAKRATDSGIRTFSVGITPSVNQQELLILAGNNDNRVFTTENFDELIKLLTPLSVKICPLE